MKTEQKRTIHFRNSDELIEALRSDFLSHLFYSRREVAEVLGVSRAEVERLLDEGVLTEITLGDSGGGISARDVIEILKRRDAATDPPTRSRRENAA